MTGKEALIQVSKSCSGLALEFGNLKIGKTDNEALQTLKEIVQKYDKYKRAFEILKDELNIELGKEEHTFKDFKDIYYYMSIEPAWQDTKTTFELSQKEHELLEELMKGEEIR